MFKNKVGTALLRVIILVFISAVIVGCTGDASISHEVRSQNSPAVSLTPYHPRLFFGNDDLLMLKAKVTSDPGYSWWETIRADAEYAMKNDFLSTITNLGGKAHYAHYLAFAYLLSDIPSYAVRSAEALLAARPQIVAADMRIDFLNTADALNRYVMSYDWVIDSGLVTRSQRETIEANLTLIADLLYHNLKIPLEDWRSAKGNERLRADAALGLAALGLVGGTGNVSRTDEWLDFAINDLFSPDGHIACTITTDGAFVEGPSYGDYTFEEFLPFAHAYGRLKGIDLLAEPRIQNYFDWLVKIRMPDGSMPTFDTGWRFSLNLQMVVAGDHHNGGFYMWDWGHYNNSVQSLTYTYPLTQYIIYYDSAVKASEPTLPPTQFLPEGGQAVFRSGWGEDATYLLLLAEHSPDISTHEQPDQSSFMLYAHGAFLAIDPGDGRHYDADRQNWIRSAKSHNLILVDGQGPEVVSDYTRVKDPAFLREYFSFKDIDYAEATVSYAGIDLSRKVLFPNHEYFVIADDIKADSSHRYDFGLHFGDSNKGQLTIEENMVIWETVNDNGENVALLVSLSSDSGELQITSHKGPTDYDHDNRIFEHTYIEAGTNGKDVSFLTILYPSLKLDESPVMTKLGSVRNGQAMKLNVGNREDFVYLGSDAEIVDMAGFEFQAKLVFASLISGHLACFTVTPGKNLAYNGHRLFESEEEAISSFSYGSGVIEGRIYLEKAGFIHLSVDNFRRVVLNGLELSPKHYQYESTCGILTLHLLAGTNALSIVYGR